jgi:hypothetical protein
MLEREDEGNIIFRNLSNYLPVEMVQRGGRPESSALPL